MAPEGWGKQMSDFVKIGSRLVLFGWLISSFACSKQGANFQEQGAQENAPVVNALCGSTPSSCTKGTLQEMDDNDNLFLWKCMGSSGEKNSNCQISKNPPPPPPPPTDEHI